MAAISLTCSTISNPFTATSLVYFETATESAVNTPQSFLTTVKSADDRIAIIVDNPSGLTPCYASVKGGDFAGAGDKSCGLLEPGAISVFYIESGFCKKANGKIEIILTPEEGSSLASIGAKVAAVEYLPVVNN